MLSVARLIGFFLVSTLTLPGAVLASVPTDASGQVVYPPGAPPEDAGFDRRHIIIQLDDATSQAVRSAALSGGSTAESGGASPALDALNRELGVQSMSPIFPARSARRKAGKSTPADDWRSEYFLVRFEDEIDVRSAVQRYRARASVRSAQLNYLYTPDLVPNDPGYSSQYAHAITQAEAGWDIETGDPNVVVAVIGTGVQLDHEDLVDNIWENSEEVPANLVDDDLNGFVDDVHGWDLYDDDSDPSPSSSHETEVAGVAAAVADNSLGVAGVAWSAGIMVLRVEYTSADVAVAIDYANDNGADVVNMSFGNYDVSEYGPDTIVETAVNDAYANGVVLVATAGNDAIRTKRYPAALGNVIATSATTSADERANFSNFGSWVSVAAPGVGIYTTTTGGGYATVNGTSYAAPYVSGLALLLLSKNPGLSPTSVRRRIEYSVDKITTDRFIGSGRVNVANALSLTADPDLFAIIKSPMTGSLVDGLVEIYGTAIGDQYALELRPEGETGWTELAVGSTTYDGVLGSFDTTAYTEQSFEVRLTATKGVASDQHVITLSVGAGLLEGWPRYAGGAVLSAPSYSDVDGDGDREIFVGTNTGPVQGWHHDGANLTGWARTVAGGYGSPAIGDVDADGEVEILFGGFYTGDLYAWNLDGTSLAGWPQEIGAGMRGAAALADLDGDGVLDIVATAAYWIRAFAGDGSPLPGWPIAIERNSQATPAVGDIDGDGDPEVIVFSGSWIYALHHDGSAVSGWPVSQLGHHVHPMLADLDGDGDEEVIVGTGDYVISYQGDGSVHWSTTVPGLSLYYTALALGDVDGDGVAEICGGGQNGLVAIIDDTGAVLPGFPVSIGDKSWGCIMADIDDDGLQEIVVTSQDSLVYSFDGDGSVPSGGWPRAGGASLYASAAIGDVDADGSLDMMFGNEDGDVFVMRLDTPDHPGAAHWPMFQGGEGHTGRFAFTDSDGDGVVDDAERAGPNGGDSNVDGTADFQQANVATLPGAGGAGDYVTVQVSGGCSTLSHVETYSEADMPEPDHDYDYPYGLVGFTAPCAVTTVSIFFHGASLGEPAYRKYGPSAPGVPATNGWYDFHGASFTSTTIGGQPALESTFTLYDGVLGDSTGSDGQIVDPGGLVEASLAPPVPALTWAGFLVLAISLSLATWVSSRARGRC